MIENNNKRWIFIPLGILIFMCLGTVYSWSVFRKPVEDLLKINATQSGLPYMFFLFFYAVLMPVAGGFIDEYNPKFMTIIGGLIVSLGWFLSGFATNIIMLSITYGIIAGGGVGITYGVPIAVAAKWYPDKKGLAVGLTLLGFGLSPFVTAPLANMLVASYGVLKTFKILGIGFAVIISLLALPLKFPDSIKISNSNKSDNNKSINIKTAEMLKKKTFYGLWGNYIIGTLIGLMAIGITTPVAVEIINLNAAKAALMVSLFSIFNGLGRPLFGWITDEFSPKIASIISYVLIIIASILMLNAGNGKMIIFTIAFSLFWLNLGGWLAIAPAATGIFFGAKNYSKNYGYVFTAYGIGAILGTLISGRIKDLLGSYIFTFYPTIVLAIIGLILTIVLLKKPEKGK
ncbi:MAG TPA: OFA family MFS transporter [Halanaerobiales bacterium]|nr:OFA family MFS transporter [Halanaerobiales bacterium]